MRGLLPSEVPKIMAHSSTPQLPFKTPKIPSNRDHKTLIEVHWGSRYTHNFGIQAIIVWYFGGPGRRERGNSGLGVQGLQLHLDEHRDLSCFPDPSEQFQLFGLQMNACNGQGATWLFLWAGGPTCGWPCGKSPTTWDLHWSLGP